MNAHATPEMNPDTTSDTSATAPRPFKIPRSVLVVIHTVALDVLLLERADRPEHWQSVTGSLDAPDEPAHAAARREVMEETSIDATVDGVLDDWQHAISYDIYPHWRHRYAPGVTRNTEAWFGLLLPADFPARNRVRVAPREHLQYAWLPHEEAARRCFSPSNAAAILELPVRLSARRP